MSFLLTDYKKLSASFTRFRKKLFLLIQIVWLSKTSANPVSCESEHYLQWGHVGSQKTCLMTNLTTIETVGCSILGPKDNTIRGLSFQLNKKILFLPAKFSEVFSSLIVYNAYGCSLTTVFKSNFEGLTRLIRLDLSYNKIVKISSNTFEDLFSLEWLGLGNETYNLKNNFMKIFFRTQWN